MFQPTHWLHIFLVSKIVGHHFCLSLMAGAKIEQGRITKKQIPPGPPERKNQGPSLMHAKPSHWLHDSSISKTIHHHFWLGLMVGSMIWGHNTTC
jgi:hypothetical protein